MSKRMIAMIVVLLILVGGAGVLYNNGTLLAPKPTPTPDANLDDFENLITASGTLLPEQRASLSFKLAGQVTELAVQAGQTVKKGDVLARLDAAELLAAVAQAQAAQALAQANLDQLQAGASKQDIAAAQANVDTAQAQLAKVMAGASAEEVAMAKAGLDRAASGLKAAQSAYDRVSSDPAIGMLPQSAALQAAFQEYRIAEARYNQVLKGASAQDVRLAQAGIAVAEANLARVTAGARPAELIAAQARIDQAQAAVKQAQATLTGATLTAPFDGLVALVNVREGEVATPGAPVIVLGDVSRLRLETDDLSETNIARVQSGQVVSVSFEALPGKTFNGKVTRIAPISTPKQGGTNYTVTVEMDGLDAALRWGMTGHLEINAR